MKRFKGILIVVSIFLSGLIVGAILFANTHAAYDGVGSGKSTVTC